MFDIVLFEPQIAGNTGNVIRLCANVGARLHLIKPLGFSLKDRYLKRAGLDYHEYVTLTVHEDWRTCCAHLNDRRLFALTTKGQTRYADAAFRLGDVFVFGQETRGLPATVLAQVTVPQQLRLPMVPNSRSLNLSNAVAVLVFEAWRQCAFVGAL